MGDLSGVGLGLEKEKLELGRVRDNEHLVTGGNHVASLLVRSVADFGHADGSAETATDARVDTLGLAPLVSKTLVTVVMVALELLSVLLHDLWVRERLGHGWYKYTIMKIPLYQKACRW